MISTITLDTYKQQISSGDAFNLSDSFNGRVGDEQVPLVVQFKERGLAQQFQDGLVPFLTGFVGSLDENNQVTAETGEAVSYVGTSSDIVGLGRVKMNLPGTMFPQEGYFYGFLGLQNADGKRVTTFNVWFHVYNGNPDMFVNKAPFRTELQKLLDTVQSLISGANGDLNTWKQKLTDLFTTLSAQGTDTATLLTTLQAQIKQSNLFTQGQMDELLGSLTSLKPIGSNLIDKLNNEFSSRAVNVQWFGAKGDGSHDDLAAINQAIAATNPGTKIVFPAGNYKISGNVMIDKKVTLLGTKPVFDSNDLTAGTVIRGGGIFFTTGSSGSSATGIGVVVATGFTNGFDLRGVISDVEITDCLTIAQSHGFLVESYDGLVNNVKIRHCNAYDSIHGFISKASRTTFEDCTAQNMSSYGFGMISDNIPGTTKKGEAVNNQLSNCRTITCAIGYIAYCRNYFGTTKAVNNIGLQLSNCSAFSSVHSIILGDLVGDTGSGDYTTFSIDSPILIGFDEEYASNSIEINYTTNLVISGMKLTKPAMARGASSDPKYSNNGAVITGVSGAKAGDYQTLQLLPVSATPSLGFGRVFRSNNANGSLVSITNFTDAVDSEVYEIVLWDDNTQIVAGEKITLQGAPLSGRNSSIRLKCQSGMFFEMSRSYSGVNKTLNKAYADATDIALGTAQVLDLAGTGTLANKISINNPAASASMLTVMVRASTGTLNFGGFDSAQFIVPTDLPKSVDFGIGLATQWLYMPAVSKYIFVSKSLSKYA
ncbi:glycosyl hydrolase family 28-related protein [Lactiplantibacillus plantarum]|uniref:glycosyl hydrolase family 28-related protein n=1 Tax=Lactiplantibacillus plantarum TaxID=1590 RepID=UPI003C149507